MRVILARFYVEFHLAKPLLLGGGAIFLRCVARRMCLLLQKLLCQVVGTQEDDEPDEKRDDVAERGVFRE